MIEIQCVAFRGTVKEAVYIRTDTRYLIELPNKETVVARVQNMARHQPDEFALGDAVVVWCDAGDVRVLTA